MALFKILRGPSSGLDALPLKDGYCYFTADTGLFYIDYEKDGELKRIPLNAADAATLSGATLAQVLNNNELEIPSSALIYELNENIGERFAELTANKQDKIIGTEGQIVGIDADGNPIALNASAAAVGGLIDTNSGALIKLWYGSKEEYDALDPKDDYTIYILSDEVGGDVFANEVAYDNTLSGLMGTNVQTVIDEIVRKKQDKLVGQSGQIVGFDADGNPVAQEAPKPAVEPTYVLEENKGLQQKFWRGTKEEYDALTEKDESTMYIVVDDEGGSTISAVQPDWNQNDESAVDYIKNRTHYAIFEKIPFKSGPVVFENLTRTFVDGFTDYIDVDNADGLETFRFTEGVDYIVVWDGVEYTCQPDDNMGALGYVGGSYPFRIHAEWGDVGVFAKDSDGNNEAGTVTHTFSIYEATEIVHKLDEKYLPEFIINVTVNESLSNWYPPEITMSEINKAYDAGLRLILNVIRWLDIDKYYYLPLASKGESGNDGYRIYTFECDDFAVSIVPADDSAPDGECAIEMIRDAVASDSMVYDHDSDTYAHQDIRDTLGELATAFNENKEVVDALDEAIVNKANKADVYTKTEIDAVMPTIFVKNW